MLSLIAKCRQTTWLVFVLVCAWKLALFLISAQPVPSNDAFFYDGAVVNELLHGQYTNPSIALALPISGTQVFSAYPPLYQGVLWLWMSVFGTSALSAIALHLALFGAYAMVLYAILKRLAPPDWCFHLAGGYLLVITFHDRPDSLAHLLGMLAVYSWICSRQILGDPQKITNRNQPSATMLAAMVLFVVLTLCTSVQIGAIYLFLIWVGLAATSLAGRERFPIKAAALTILIPAALALFVKLGFPLLWNGFIEHARQTPSWTGWRWPGTDLLKVGRTVPGIALVAVFVPWAWLKQHNNVEYRQYARYELVLLPVLLASIGVVAACLFVLTANMVAIANYLQPLVVASYLAFAAVLFRGQSWFRIQTVLLCLALALGSIRAIGMSTWGLACARDAGYADAMQQIDRELENEPAGSKVVASSAFLYEASRHTNVTLIHSDWMHPAKDGSTDLQALRELKPRLLILTQFDYYRRYKNSLQALGNEPGGVHLVISNAAHLLPPDAYPSLQRVVQHVSWAPVVVGIDWIAK